MRDGVVLRADVWRPSPTAASPCSSIARPTTGATRRAGLHRRPRRGARLRGGGAGRARPVRLGRRLRPLSQRGARRLRHHRVGGGPALVRRRGGDVRPVVSGRRAVAGRAGIAPAPQGHGPRDDVLHAAQLLLRRRRLRHVVAGRGSGTTSRPTRASAAAWPGRARARRRGRSGTSIRDGVLRRLPLQALDEFRDVAPYLFEWLRHPPGDPWWDWAEVRGRYGRVERGGAEHLGVARRGLRPGRGAHELPRARGGAAGPAGRADEADPRALGPRRADGQRRGAVPLRRPRVRPRGGHRLRRDDPAVHGPLRARARQRRRPRAGGARLRHGRERLARGRPLAAAGDRAAHVVLDGEPMPGRMPRWPGARSRVQPRGLSSFLSDPARPVTDPYAADGRGPRLPAAARNARTSSRTKPRRSRSDLRVVGPITAEIYVSTERAKDVDIWVKLFDVAPDGTAFNLMSPGLDVMRASYREGGPSRKLLRPGRVYPIRFENLMTGNTSARATGCGSWSPARSSPTSRATCRPARSEVVSAASRPRSHHRAPLRAPSLAPRPARGAVAVSLR